MGIADLIQHNCQDQNTAKLTVQKGREKAQLFFSNGRVVHATLNGKEGEDVVFKVLAWTEGKFDLDMGAKSPKESIESSWNSLVLEGARLMDEKEAANQIDQKDFMEDSFMGESFSDVMKALADETKGFAACSVVGMDGLAIAQHTTTQLDPEAISALMTTIFKLVDESVTKLDVGVLEDNLLTTENHFVLMRFFPGKKYLLAILADKNISSLGNLRLVSKMYCERIAKILPQ